MGTGVKSEKEKISVVVITTSVRIVGEMHIVPGGRLLDEVNKEREFLPITGATIYDVQGENIIDTLDFIAVNRNQILLIAPGTPEEAKEHMPTT